MEKPCITGLCVLMRSLGNSELVPGSHEARGSIPLSSTNKISGLAKSWLSLFSLQVIFYQSFTSFRQ